MTTSTLIRNARIKKGMTQAEVAEALGVSGQLISNAERGVAGLPVKYFRKTCEILDIDLVELLHADYLYYKIRVLKQLR